jgi:transposase InsO family protein
VRWSRQVQICRFNRPATCGGIWLRVLAIEEPTHSRSGWKRTGPQGPGHANAADLMRCECPFCSRSTTLRGRIGFFKKSFHTRSIHNAWVIAREFLHWPRSRAELSLLVTEGGIEPQWALAMKERIDRTPNPLLPFRAAQRIQPLNGSQIRSRKHAGGNRLPAISFVTGTGPMARSLIRRLLSIGIRDRPTSPRSPWQNGYAERLIGSIRRECLDHVIVFSERHLRHVSFVKNVSEHRFTQGVVAIGGDRVSIAGRVKVREPVAEQAEVLAGGARTALMRSPSRPLRWLRRIRWSSLRWPITGSTAARRRISRRMALVTRRTWPLIQTLNRSG